MKYKTLIDPLGLANNLFDVGHHGNGGYCVELTSLDQIDSIMPLIRQSLEKNKK